MCVCIGDNTVYNTSINARCLWEQSSTGYISCATGTEEEEYCSVRPADLHGSCVASDWRLDQTCGIKQVEKQRVGRQENLSKHSFTWGWMSFYRRRQK